MGFLSSLSSLNMATFNNTHLKGKQWVELKMWEISCWSHILARHEPHDMFVAVSLPNFYFQLWPLWIINLKWWSSEPYEFCCSPDFLIFFQNVTLLASIFLPSDIWRVRIIIFCRILLAWRKIPPSNKMVPLCSSYKAPSQEPGFTSLALILSQLAYSCSKKSNSNVFHLFILEAEWVKKRGKTILISTRDRDEACLLSTPMMACSRINTTLK